MATRLAQIPLFDSEPDPEVSLSTSSTFVSNMSLPVHKWFRYSAGFSADWVESVIKSMPGDVRVFDPFSGSATTLLAAEAAGAESWGLEAHPFVYRVARAKLAWRTDAQAYLRKIEELKRASKYAKPDIAAYPSLIRKCYEDEALKQLDALRQGYEDIRDDSPASELAWLTLVAILRKVSTAGTAQWQYILPKKRKRAPADVATAFEAFVRVIYHDMRLGESIKGRRPISCWVMHAHVTGYPKVSQIWSLRHLLTRTTTIMLTPRDWKCLSCVKSAGGVICKNL
jgi:hypothetical protein